MVPLFFFWYSKTLQKIIMKLLDGAIVSTIVHKNNNPGEVRKWFLQFFQYSNFIQF